MKCISLFILCAASAFAADFTTGQAARLVIGQTTFTNQDPNSSDTVLGAVSGLAYAADTLFVADSNRVGASPSNHRVLLYQNFSSTIPDPTALLRNDLKCPVCVGKSTVVLGQPDFTTTTLNLTSNRNNLRLPTALASDGVRLVVADTDHNRVLIWNRIPASNNIPADVVVGQPDFNTVAVPLNGVPSAKSMRGPQGVWIQNGKLFVADTLNNRILIFNSIPTANGAAADIVLGQPNFTTAIQVDISQDSSSATASNLLNPTSVATDGQRLYVADLGFNRVLIWNKIPTTNTVAADVEIGQPDMVSGAPNYAYTADSDSIQTPVMCKVSNGADTDGNLTYPTRCSSTLSFPRYAMAVGNKLFVADGGNDRVLIYNTIPTANGAAADVVLGQVDGVMNQASDSVDSLRTPMSLAWDGANLYVSDAFNRRILVYSPAENLIPYAGVRNGASFEIFAIGYVSVAGSISAGDTATVNISYQTTTDPAEYTYTVKDADSLADIIDALVDIINSSNDGAGDPYVIATADHNVGAIRLTARAPGDSGNSVYYSVATSTNAKVILTGQSSLLSGGADAARIPAGTLVSITPNEGASLSFGTASADLTKPVLPMELANTRVYFDGLEAPLLYVSPTQINAQIPWEVVDSTSINCYVRSVKSDGTVVVSNPVAVTIVPANPGIFTYFNSQDLPPAIALHGSSHATGAIVVGGSISAGDIATVTINGRDYAYTVVAGDALETVRDGLVALINASDPEVTAEPSSQFAFLILKARVSGPDGNGIPFGITTTAGSLATGGALAVSALGLSELCCANVQGSLVTQTNPAVPGEPILLYVTGAGMPAINDVNRDAIHQAMADGAFNTGVAFPAGTPKTSPQTWLYGYVGSQTAQILGVIPKVGTFGVFEVYFLLPPGLDSNPYTPIRVSQDVYESNLVTLPVVNPAATQ